MSSDFQITCPVPQLNEKTVQLAHGGGGSAMRGLIEKLFLPAFANQTLDARHDSAALGLEHPAIAFTTDSYVVKPLFFPGGDIGQMAIYGTVNDLAMAGAQPLYLSAAFILEEGFPIEQLRLIVNSMREATQRCGIEIVTGDTKVVDHGKGDGLFVNTAGIGLLRNRSPIGPRQVRPGDAVILSGDLGRHGIAVMSVREGLAFETSIESDCAPLWTTVARLIEAGVEIHCMRDLTRGGLASALNEIAADGAVGVEIDETAVPIDDSVFAACEILGLDPLYVANEGRFVIFVPQHDAQAAIAAMRRDPVAGESRQIGEVSGTQSGIVSIRGVLGNLRVLDLLSGEQLPRIC